MNNLLKGRTFVLTGTFKNLTRQEAKDRIEEAGGIVKVSLDKETDCVVVGGFGKPGTKAKKAESLGLKIIDEDEFLKILGSINSIFKKKDPPKTKKYDLKKHWHWEPSEFGPSQELPGGGLGEDAIDLFEKPTTFYVIKIKVPMKDGSSSFVHKAGVCVGRVLGGRYPQNSPVEVWVEIGNLHRSLARTIEGKMLLIMGPVPWSPSLFQDLLDAESEAKIKWRKEFESGDDVKYYSSFLAKTEFILSYIPKREALFEHYFKEKGIVEPDISNTWAKNYGLSEWRLWNGTKAELIDQVNKIKDVSNDFFVPYQLSVPPAMEELYWKWTKSKFRTINQ